MKAISCICWMQISASGAPASSGQMLTSSFLGMLFSHIFHLTQSWTQTWTQGAMPPSPESFQPANSWHCPCTSSPASFAYTGEHKHCKEELFAVEKYSEKNYTQQHASLIHPVSKMFCCVWARRNKHGCIAHCLGSTLHNNTLAGSRVCTPHW